MLGLTSIAVTISLREDLSDNDGSNIIKILEEMKCKFMICFETSGKNPKRHCHVAILSGLKTVSAFNQSFRRHMFSLDKERFPFGKQHHWYKGVAWYVGGPNFEPKMDDNVCREHDTWEKYVMKDGDYQTFGEPCEGGWAEWDKHRESILAPNKTPEEQKQKFSWAEMAAWQASLNEHELPFGDRDEVEDSILTLAYVKQVKQLPRMSDMKALIHNLWNYMNKTKFGMKSFEDYIDSGAEDRKRRRVETEEDKEDALDRMKEKYLLRGKQELLREQAMTASDSE